MFSWHIYHSTENSTGKCYFEYSEERNRFAEDITTITDILFSKRNILLHPILRAY